MLPPRRCFPARDAAGLLVFIELGEGEGEVGPVAPFIKRECLRRTDSFELRGVVVCAAGKFVARVRDLSRGEEEIVVAVTDVGRDGTSASGRRVSDAGRGRGEWDGDAGITLGVRGTVKRDEDAIGVARRSDAKWVEGAETTGVVTITS